MAKYLNTTAINFELENLIKSSTKFLILISPYLKIAPRLKDLIKHQSSKVPIIIVYGKEELKDKELAWFKSCSNIRLHYCSNLHGKCYINQSSAILSSMNLYDFSQINNNEMGILINTKDDREAITDAYEDAKYLISISDVVSDSISSKDDQDDIVTLKLTSSKIAKKHKLTTPDFIEKMLELGFLEAKGDKHHITDKAKGIGAEFKRGRFGFYFLWPDIDFF